MTTLQVAQVNVGSFIIEVLGWSRRPPRISGGHVPGEWLERHDRDAGLPT